MANFYYDEPLPQHECELPFYDTSRLEYRRMGWVDKLRRWWLGLWKVSRHHPQSRILLPSSVSVSQEVTRHLSWYRTTVHPFSTFRVLWDGFMVVVLLLTLIVAPYLGAFLYPGRHIPGYNILLVLECLCLLDVFVNCNTGYFNHDTGEIVLGHRMVLVKYLMTDFWWHFLSSLPNDYLNLKVSHNKELNSYLWVYSQEFLYVCKSLKMFQLATYIFRVTEFLQLKFFVVKQVMSLTKCLLFLHWMTCFYYIINVVFQGCDQDSWDARSWMMTAKLKRTTPWVKYRKGLYRSVVNLFLVGLGLQSSVIPIDMVYSMLCAICGYYIILYTTVQLMIMMRIMDTSTTDHQQSLSQLNEFISHKHLPKALAERLRAHYLFRLQKSFFREPQILRSLSRNLHADMMMDRCRRLVQTVDFFQNIPEKLMIRIVSCLKSEILLENDLVMMAGTQGDCMYFIASGTVAIYTSAGHEVCHLQDGAHFGEIALVMEGAARVASVVVVEAAELYVLSRKDFKDAVEPYPHLLERIQATARERLATTRSLH